MLKNNSQLKRYYLGENQFVKLTPVPPRPVPPTPVPPRPVIPSKLKVIYISDNDKINIPQTLFNTMFPNCNIDQITVNYLDFSVNFNYIMDKYKDKNIFLLQLNSTSLTNLLVPFLVSNNSYVTDKLFFSLFSTVPRLRELLTQTYQYLPIYFIIESDDFFIYKNFELTQNLKSCVILPNSINSNSVYFLNLSSIMDEFSIDKLNEEQVLNNLTLTGYSVIYIIHDDFNVVKQIISDLKTTFFNGSVFLVDYSPNTNELLNEMIDLTNDNIVDITLLSPGTNFTVELNHPWVQSLKLDKSKSLPSNVLCIYNLITSLTNLLLNKPLSSYYPIIESSSLFNKGLFESSSYLNSPFFLNNSKSTGLYIVDDKYLELDDLLKLINIREKNDCNIIIYPVNNETRNYNNIKQFIDELDNFEKIKSICIIGNSDEVPSFMRKKIINDETYYYPSDITYGIIDNAISIPVGRISSGNIIDIETQKSIVSNTLRKIINNEEYILNLTLPNDPINKWLTYIIGIASNDKNGTISDDLFVKNELEKFVNQKYENYINNTNYIELFDGSLFDSPNPVDENGNILDKPGDPTEDELINYINTLGCGLIEYLGHGLIDKLETTDFSIDNVKELKNENKYFLLITVACSIGDFSDMENICLADKLQMSEYGSYGVFASVIPQTFEPPKSLLKSINELIRNTKKNLTLGDLFLNGINSRDFLWSELKGNGLNISDECLYYTLFGDPLSGYTPSHMRINKKTINTITYRGKFNLKKKINQVKRNTLDQLSSIPNPTPLVKQQINNIVSTINKVITNIPTQQMINEWRTKITEATNIYNIVIDKIKNIPRFEIDFGNVSLIMDEFELTIFFNTNVPYNSLKNLIIMFYKLNFKEDSNITFQLNNTQTTNLLQFFFDILKNLYKINISEAITLIGSIGYFLSNQSISFNLGINKLICNPRMEITNLSFKINNKFYFLTDPDLPFNTGDSLYFNNILNENKYIQISVDLPDVNVYAAFWITPEEFIDSTDLNKKILNNLISYISNNNKTKNILEEINKILFSIANFSTKTNLSLLDYLDISLDLAVRMCFLAPPPNTYQWGNFIEFQLDPVKFVIGYFNFLTSLLQTINVNELNKVLNALIACENELKGISTPTVKTIFDTVTILITSLSFVISNIDKYSSIATKYLDETKITNKIEEIIPIYEFMKKTTMSLEYYIPLLV